jgi:hypothetical protein
MPLWAALVLGLVGLFTVSVLVALSVGAILGQISREVTDLLDAEPWQQDATVATGSSNRPAQLESYAKRSLPAA